MGAATWIGTGPGLPVIALIAPMIPRKPATKDAYQPPPGPQSTGAPLATPLPDHETSGPTPAPPKTVPKKPGSKALATVTIRRIGAIIAQRLPMSMTDP